jgi:hypothetical protein
MLFLNCNEILYISYACNAEQCSAPLLRMLCQDLQQKDDLHRYPVQVVFSMFRIEGEPFWEPSACGGPRA